MLTKVQKQSQIDALAASLAPAAGCFAMEFRGLKVGEITELRRKVREADGGYIVVKNTLAKIAVTGSPNEVLKDLLSGPVAVAYTAGDVVNLAKVLAEFAKGHDKLKFRGGVVEGRLLDPKQAELVSTLPTKPELVAKLLYVLQSPMRRLVTALNWPIQGLAVSLRQIAENQENQERQAQA